MYSFNEIGAWANGIRFLKARSLENLILIGVLGFLAPFAVQIASQYALTGAIFESAARPAEPSLAYMLAPLAALLLQAGGFFAAWRLGLGERETLGGALRYGLLAGLLASLAAVAMLVAAGLAATSMTGSPAFGLFVLLFSVAPLILLLALFGTLAAAVIGVAVAITLAAAMLYGVAIGNPGLAATMVGGSGFVAVLLLLLSVLLLWLAARLSCVTAAMADRRSFNLVAAARVSWEITGEGQWRIMGYLSLLGFLFIVLLVAGIAAIGGGAAARRRFRRPRPKYRARRALASSSPSQACSSFWRPVCRPAFICSSWASARRSTSLLRR